MNTETLRIVELHAENVKRLKAVRLRPDKTLVRIEGRNAQGKSSVLDAIAAALGGGKWNPEEPVRRGEKKASVRLDLGELQVERRWTAKGGTTLEVTANGARLSTPQAILDKLLGDLTFDPVAFERMGDKQQADLLRSIAGLDFSALDAERERVYAERTVSNREAKAAEARVGTPPPKPQAVEPVSVRDLANEQQQAIANNRRIDELEDANRRALQDAEAYRAQITSLQERIRTIETQARANSATLAGLKRLDVEAIGNRIMEAESVNSGLAAYTAWQERGADAKRKADAADALDRRIKEIDAEKDRKLAAAKFPLNGLGIDANGVTLDGIPFSQASSAERLRTSVALGLAQCPRARIMLIRDGSLLDGDNLNELHKIAEEFDAQVFVERVADTKSPSAVYIEDGEVQE